MATKTKVSLRGLKSELMTIGWMANKIESRIKNRKGQIIGKFITSGVGLDEHKRRLKAVAKDKVKSIKAEHEK